MNSFENELRDPTAINFYIMEKWSGTSYRPINIHLIPTITTCHNLIGYFKAQFIQADLESPQSKISKFNIGGRGRGGCGHIRGYGRRRFVCGCGCGQRVPLKM